LYVCAVEKGERNGKVDCELGESDDDEGDDDDGPATGTQVGRITRLPLSSHSSQYFDNLIYFGLGPRKQADGSVAIALPLGGAPLPGVAAEDIGRVAAGIFAAGDETLGKTIPIAGSVESGADYARELTTVLGKQVAFVDVPFATFAASGAPGADDLPNMFEFQQLEAEYFKTARDPAVSKKYHPSILSLRQFLAKNKDKLQIAE